MKELIRKKFEEHWDEMISDLAAVVAINSVRGEETPAFPFGEAPAKALAVALEMGSRMGFSVENVDNYAGTIDLGDQPEMIGVMAHLDIVPAGKGWTTDPFTLDIRNGRIYGRGVTDNKGPVVGALYGMRILRELNVPLKKRIRLIVGTNEEQGSACMKYYAEHRPIPECGFTPDAEYPLIYGEKGNLWTKLHFPLEKDSPILELTGGEMFNAVPAECRITLDQNRISRDALSVASQKAEMGGFMPEISQNAQGDWLIVIKGHAAHGSTPHLGTSAIVSAANFLVALLDEKAGKLPLFIHEQIKREPDGATLGVKRVDAESGSLTLNLGMMRLNQAESWLGIDIRFPVTLTLAEMRAIYQAMADRFELTFDVVETAEPHFVPQDSEVVTKLLGVYRDVTGNQAAQGFTIGGGTYAKALGKKFVAFGPEFPGTEPLNVHDADEHAVIQDFLNHCVICTMAMAALAE